MNQNSDKQIFFHVGLGKTASTYLQERVFPLFKNIEYIHRVHRYNKAVEIIANGNAEKYLISREFDQQFEYEVKNFSAHYPNTTVIIVFRRQDSWIASQYRRFFKNGHIIPFSEFFDLKEDKGMFKKIDLNFYHYLELIEKYFTKKPLVLFYDDLRKEPMPFFDYIAKHIDVEYDKKSVNLDNKHSSYNEQQLKTLKRVSKVISLRKDNMKYPFFYPLKRFYTNMIRYSALYVGKYLPNSWYSKEPLINAEELKAVRDYYESDWRKVIEYAKKNNP